MNSLFIPNDAPFSADQRAWIAGFLAGLQSNALTSDKQLNAGGDSTLLNIIFGTQTGNAEGVAEEFAQIAKKRGLQTSVSAMDDVAMESLESMSHMLAVVSTYGEGEMPDNAQLFWDALSSDEAPDLKNLEFGVFALGDTGYEEFCQAGKLIDTRLEQLGAKRIIPRVDCDVEFEDLAAKYIVDVLPLVSDGIDTDDETGSGQFSGNENKEKSSQWSRKNPFFADVKLNTLMSGRGSKKEIRHYELSLGDSNLTYEVGDSLGVMPINDPDLVDLILTRLGLDPDQIIDNQGQNLKFLLTHKQEISTPSKTFIREIEKLASNDELSHVLKNSDKEALDAFLWGKDILDLLNLNAKIAMDADTFFSLLKPLQHRAYSISSSQKAHPDSVHLTISSVRWNSDGRTHKGVCSTHLADRCPNDEKVGIFVAPNKSFRIPKDNSAPMIMVGPGTGVAPFRAFLQERQEIGAGGKNWLFFGDQKISSDFIYQDELSELSKSGLLTRMDLAFSRDQDEKIYVQNRMMENGKALFEWLDSGGYFYVCGDATRMAKDVDIALRKIVEKHAGLSEELALEYVKNLKKQKRYLRDVY